MQPRTSAAAQRARRGPDTPAATARTPRVSTTRRGARPRTRRGRARREGPRATGRAGRGPPGAPRPGRDSRRGARRRPGRRARRARQPRPPSSSPAIGPARWSRRRARPDARARAADRRASVCASIDTTCARAPLATATACAPDRSSSAGSSKPAVNTSSGCPHRPLRCRSRRGHDNRGAVDAAAQRGPHPRVALEMIVDRRDQRLVKRPHSVRAALQLAGRVHVRIPTPENGALRVAFEDVPRRHLPNAFVERRLRVIGEAGRDVVDHRGQKRRRRAIETGQDALDLRCNQQPIRECEVVERLDAESIAAAGQPAAPAIPHREAPHAVQPPQRAEPPGRTRRRSASRCRSAT